MSYLEDDAVGWDLQSRHIKRKREALPGSAEKKKRGTSSLGGGGGRVGVPKPLGVG